MHPIPRKNASWPRKGQGIYIIAAGAAGYISGADGSDSQLRGEDEALPSSMFFNVLTNHGHRKSNESAGPGMLGSLKAALEVGGLLRPLQKSGHPRGSLRCCRQKRTPWNHRSGILSKTTDFDPVCRGFRGHPRGLPSSMLSSVAWCVSVPFRWWNVRGRRQRFVK